MFNKYKLFKFKPPMIQTLVREKVYTYTTLKNINNPNAVGTCSVYYISESILGNYSLLYLGEKLNSILGEEFYKMLLVNDKLYSSGLVIYVKSVWVEPLFGWTHD